MPTVTCGPKNTFLELISIPVPTPTETPKPHLFWGKQDLIKEFLVGSIKAPSMLVILSLGLFDLATTLIEFEELPSTTSSIKSEPILISSSTVLASVIAESTAVVPLNPK